MSIHPLKNRASVRVKTVPDTLGRIDVSARGRSRTLRASDITAVVFVTMMTVIFAAFLIYGWLVGGGIGH
jgi:hypothetical protein